ncbi:putative glycosidase crf1 [Zancudomyces culisetae]|uniref:Putative glycosidase crf1 n=1 Tax=Zancudomyces culisetae TaxID=1213189 RepID=A0A1R1PJ21_ZANCU|nr:putative glycosidase crf1 [Zancudomyces culisetae]|eukprot:OMH80852.1 putative glycosidase crf1 [Zancudomyces culisetae]
MYMLNRLTLLLNIAFFFFGGRLTSAPIKRQNIPSPDSIPNEVPNTTPNAVQQEYLSAENYTCQSVFLDFTKPETLSKVSVDWCPQNAVITSDGLKMELNSNCGTTLVYPYSIKTGKIEASIKMAPGSGAVTALVLAGPPPSDELDIEFVGKDVTSFQSMYFVRAQRYQLSPILHTATGSSSNDLSTVFNTYSMELLSNAVNWGVNGNIVRTLGKISDDTFPYQANKLRFGVWDGTNTNGWAGTIDWSSGPKIGYIKWIKITPYC